MWNMLHLIAEIVLITSSGALSPGPLTFSAIILGMRRGWKAGFMEAIGHTLFEFPLVIVIALGLSEVLKNREALRIVGAVGGFALIVFALLMALDLMNVLKGEDKKIVEVKSGPVLTGLLFTALNPYFLVWWASAGLKLIADIMLYGGLILVIALYPVHVWMDYAWLSAVAYLSSRGRSLGRNIQALIMLIFIVILLYYGVKFLFNSLI
ncbi:MAG TPA: LysE family translocator [Thermoprotei archaeon]|nr:LysE family translocator [Thermoprotei archaeon]